MGCSVPILDESRDGSGWTLVSTVEAGGVLGTGAYLFHSDLEFTDEPVRVLSLYAMEIPEIPTSTRFANGVRARLRSWTLISRASSKAGARCTCTR